MTVTRLSFVKADNNLERLLIRPSCLDSPLSLWVKECAKDGRGGPAFISSVAYREAWRSGPTSSSMSHDCLIAWHSVRAHSNKALKEMEIWKSKEGIKAHYTVRLWGALQIRGGAFNLTFVTSLERVNLVWFLLVCFVSPCVIHSSHFTA